MTKQEVKEKFEIEYDKADIASSYPSLTDFEIATILDKAYLALIAQKLTGNNPRNIGFEGDNKAIEDVRNLIHVEKVNERTGNNLPHLAANEKLYEVADDFLYYIDGSIMIGSDEANVDLISHQDAKKFKRTINNDPWMSNPVCYMDDSGIHVLHTTFAPQNGVSNLYLTYVQKPGSFWGDDRFSTDDFELNESMAEELINLAIIMAQRTVEDSRLSSNVQTRPLES